MLEEDSEAIGIANETTHVIVKKVSCAIQLQFFSAGRTKDIRKVEDFVKYAIEYYKEGGPGARDREMRYKLVDDKVSNVETVAHSGEKDFRRTPFNNISIC